MDEVMMHNRQWQRAGAERPGHRSDGGGRRTAGHSHDLAVAASEVAAGWEELRHASSSRSRSDKAGRRLDVAQSRWAGGDLSDFVQKHKNTNSYIIIERNEDLSATILMISYHFLCCSSSNLGRVTQLHPR